MNTVPDTTLANPVNRFDVRSMWNYADSDAASAALDEANLLCAQADRLKKVANYRDAKGRDDMNAKHAACRLIAEAQAIRADVVSRLELGRATFWEPATDEMITEMGLDPADFPPIHIGGLTHRNNVRDALAKSTIA